MADDDDVDPPPMGDGWAPRSAAAPERRAPDAAGPAPGVGAARHGTAELGVALALGAALALVGTQLFALFFDDSRPDPLPAPSPEPAGGAASPSPRSLVDRKGRATPFLPTGRVRLVNVWLEGCADCQPHFEAWQRFAASEVLPRDVSVANVAYTGASASFTERYRVDENLVIDADGSVVVRPLGISRFTTLVVDPHGRVCHQGHPADPGYDAALLGALTRCAREGNAAGYVMPSPATSR